ncbi:peptidyl-tRNA hydrolase [Candidatus Woesearchaeota archaeon]|nr:MAG: peptidyl-tRNA hydrolase [Candidatus Woesearchaeota archaeon]
MAFKQVILVRQDLKMPKGKLAAQVAHASVEAVEKSCEDNIKKWKRGGAKKVVLKVADLKELKKYQNLAKKAKLANALIRDAGRTFLIPGTVTCLAIGPDEEEKIDSVTGQLSML